MKVILAGYEGSKKILGISSYLISKYLPAADFDVRFLNYGPYSGLLYAGNYIELDQEQHGGSRAWSKYMAEYLEGISDELVIFALDDYLLNSPINYDLYGKLLYIAKDRQDIACARLCASDFYRNTQALGQGLVLIDGYSEYSATTQYCIWKRSFLIELLGRVRTPWEFEIEGSRILGHTGWRVVGSMIPAFHYYENSALSTKWGDRIRLDGVRQEDLDFLKAEACV